MPRTRRIAPLFAFLLFLCTVVSADALSSHISGRILIEVERHGEAWYVDPVSGTRNYLGRPEEALRLLHGKALGITNVRLTEIPVAGDGSVGNIALRQRLSGRVLLQVESHGEVWYVNPSDLKRYPLQTKDDALFLMRTFGLGITSANLSTIPVGRAETPQSVSQQLPFTAQAPFGEWNDPRQADGCEEASALMAITWARGEAFTLERARQEVLAVSDWERMKYGYFQDTSIQDTADRIFREYYGFDNIEVRQGIRTDDMLRELAAGHILLTAINGQMMNNSYYRGAGPLRHMIVVIGYDESTNEFIVHDPGTRYGAYMRVESSRLQNALQDYNSGEQVPVGPLRTAMIVVSR